MKIPSNADLLACAQAVAQASGRHALENRHRRREVAQAFRHDVKLQLDLECQRRAEEVILGAYPDHAILGEEGGAGASDGRPVWVVDPIDGTVNFSHGLPYWCTSIAVQVAGRTLAGVVYAPDLREVYAASVEVPATCNGQPIAVSDTAELGGVLALTGLEKTFDTDQGTLDVTRAVALSIQKVRLMGAAALDLCQVAAGHADAFFESGVYLWDVAAGALIVERAGGRVEVLQQVDAQRRRYLVSNGRIHDGLRAIIERARPGGSGSTPSA